MSDRNLLIISNSFPDQEDIFVGDIFVKEQVRHLKNAFDNIFVISPLAYGMERLRGVALRDYRFENVRVFFPRYLNIPLFWYYGRSLWVDLEVKAIRSVIDENHLRFDLVHAHFTWPSGAAAARLKKWYDVPIAITEHSSETLNHLLKKRDRIAIQTWGNADIIFRVNCADIDQICEVANVPHSKVRFIPNGYDDKHFYPMSIDDCRKRLGLPLDKKIILNVANPYGRVKGHHVLLKAFSELANKNANIICVVVGDGLLRPSLMSQAKALHLEDRFLFVGKKPHDQIPLWINSCNIFALPSLNEGNPTVMFECLGCGKPFIGTRVGGIPDIIDPYHHGLLAEPGDPSDLAEKMAVALDKEWDHENIAAYSRQFSWENICWEIRETYQQVFTKGI